MLEPKDIDVIILCGGLGKRLRSIVNKRPKPMAQINLQLFLDILINYISDFGFRRFILCIGYKAEWIKKYYLQKTHWDINFSEEKILLGTGGAIKNARKFIRSNPFLVLNGDSFCRINLKKLLEYHNQKNALISMALAKNSQNKDCGLVELCSHNRIKSFNEKAESKNNGLVNAGIYLFRKEIFSFMPKRRSFSLEYDFFPALTGKRCYGYLCGDNLIDIGTPEGLNKAKSYFKQLKNKKW